MKAIDIIRSSSRAGRRSLVVPELTNPETEEPLVFWFPKLAAIDLQTVDERMPRDAEGRIKPDHHERNVLLLIHKAQHEDGTPMFEWGDKGYLLKEMDFVVLQRIITFMYESAYTSLQQAKEVLREDPPSETASSSESASESH